MKPARSSTRTGPLPQAVAKAVTASTVSSEAVSGATTSTSDIIGAGLKKWTPTTLSGRSVATAISTTGRVEVLVARMAPGLHDAVELGEQGGLDREVLDHGLDDQVAVGQVADLVGGGDPSDDGVAVLLAQAALVDLLGQALLHPGLHGVGGVLLAGPQDHVVAGAAPPPRRCPLP